MPAWAASARGLAEDGVGVDAPLQAAQGFEGLLALGALAPVVGAPVGVVAQLGDRGDVDDVVDPAVPRRGRAGAGCSSPEEASRGAVPVQDANRLRSANG